MKHDPLHADDRVLADQQSFGRRPGMSQHFRLFALAEAGRARADHAFEVDALLRHLRVFVRLLDAFETTSRARFTNRTAVIVADERAHAICARLRTRLAGELPQLAIAERPLTSSYYAGVHVALDVDGPGGQRLNLSDTGVFDWMATLTSDHRLRFVASGFGLQLLAIADTAVAP